MPDRKTPFTVAGEKETLLDFLDYLRDSILIKAEGLPDEDLRRPGVPSGTSLLGLVKHLTRVEIGWFQFSLAGRAIEPPDDTLTDTDNVANVLDDYRRAIAASNDVVAGIEDLDQRCAVARRPGQEVLSARWVLVHMVEETARHAGHADILREQIDGAVGR